MTTPPERLFKVLGDDGRPHHGGTGRWHLPHDGKPGDWMPPIEGDLVPCENGYHLCREGYLADWLGPHIFEAEYRGERLDTDDKIVVREARLVRELGTWNEQTARLFACDCAERVLPLFEKERPGDERPRKAIDTARAYVAGAATVEQLAAARAAAWAAARAAARAAAWAAARAAAWAAARDAAWDAARPAARAAERNWQTDRLMHYLYPEEDSSHDD